jgi:prophage regulatory protein
MTTHLPKTGFIRLPAILRIIPIGKSTWWAGVKSGRFPRPVKLGPRTTAWRCEDIRELIVQIASVSSGSGPKNTSEGRRPIQRPEAHFQRHPPTGIHPRETEPKTGPQQPTAANTRQAIRITCIDLITQRIRHTVRLEFTLYGLSLRYSQHARLSIRHDNNSRLQIDSRVEGF